MTPQETKVLSRLCGGSLDRIEAEELGIMNLSATISRLKKRNIKINKAVKIRQNALKTRVIEVSEYFLLQVMLNKVCFQFDEGVSKRYIQLVINEGDANEENKMITLENAKEGTADYYVLATLENMIDNAEQHQMELDWSAFFESAQCTAKYWAEGDFDMDIKGLAKVYTKIDKFKSTAKRFAEYKTALNGK